MMRFKFKFKFNKLKVYILKCKKTLSKNDKKINKIAKTIISENWRSLWNKTKEGERDQKEIKSKLKSTI